MSKLADDLKKKYCFSQEQINSHFLKKQVELIMNDTKHMNETELNEKYKTFAASYPVTFNLLINNEVPDNIFKVIESIDTNKNS